MVLEEVPELHRDSVGRIAAGLRTIGGYRGSVNDSITDAYHLLHCWLDPHWLDPHPVIDLCEPHARDLGRTGPC